MLALYDMLATETVVPVWVAVPFHSCVTVWLPGQVQLSVQPFTAVVLVFWMLSATWNPVGHEFVRVNATWQVPVPPPAVPVVAWARVGVEDPAASSAVTAKKKVVEAARLVLTFEGDVRPLTISVAADGVKLAVVLRWTL